jgi:hypothetical protein
MRVATIETIVNWDPTPRKVDPERSGRKKKLFIFQREALGLALEFGAGEGIRTLDPNLGKKP